jgi:hypothetical protein
LSLTRAQHRYTIKPKQFCSAPLARLTLVMLWSSHGV